MFAYLNYTIKENANVFYKTKMFVHKRNCQNSHLICPILDTTYDNTYELSCYGQGFFNFLFNSEDRNVGLKRVPKLNFLSASNSKKIKNTTFFTRIRLCLAISFFDISI